MYATRFFLCFFVCALSILHHMAPAVRRRFGTRLYSLRNTIHDTAGRWMRGGPGARGGPDMTSEVQPGKGTQNGTHKNAKKSEECRRRREERVRVVIPLSAIGTFAHIEICSLPPPSPPLPLGTHRVEGVLQRTPLRSVSAEEI
jgi:hypothetical protein